MNIFQFASLMIYLYNYIYTATNECPREYTHIKTLAITTSYFMLYAIVVANLMIPTTQTNDVRQAQRRDTNTSQITPPPLYTDEETLRQIIQIWSNCVAACAILE